MSTTAGRARIRRKRVLLAAGVLGAVATAAAVGSELPDASEMVTTAADQVGGHAYWLVALLAFLETAAFVGFVAPAEVALVVGGVVAQSGEVELAALLIIAWLAATAGDLVGFLLGQRVGQGALLRHGGRFGLTEARLTWVRTGLERRGLWTIFAGRWVGIVRPLVPFVAGSSGMRLHRFLPVSSVSAALWVGTYVAIGHVASAQLRRGDLSSMAWPATIAAALLVAAAGWWGWRRLRARRRSRTAVLAHDASRRTLPAVRKAPP